MEQKENNRVNRNIKMQRCLEPKVSSHFLFNDFLMNGREMLKSNRNNQVYKQKHKGWENRIK